jgi:hypothetical protein
VNRTRVEELLTRDRGMDAALTERAHQARTELAGSVQDVEAVIAEANEILYPPGDTLRRTWHGTAWAGADVDEASVFLIAANLAAPGR